MQGDEVLDCKGLTCPMPILKLSKAVKKIDVGKIIEMLGTDPGSKTDGPAWCDKMGHTLLETAEGDGVYTFFVRREK